MRIVLRHFVCSCMLAMASASVATAESIVCDLRTVTSCTINGGIFAVVEVHPSGTGVIDSFVREQKKESEQGYNTSRRPVQFDEKKDPNFTRDLLLSEVGTTYIEGVAYATFYLDINEPSAKSKEFITLDQLELFTSDLGNRTGYSGVPNTASGALPGTAKVYDLDFGGDNYVQLSYDRVGKGSGSSDMAFYLPMDLFTGDYVNLFSQFGNLEGGTAKFGSGAGFEEWFTAQAFQDVPEIPEPGTMLLLGSGLVTVARRFRKGTQK